MARVGVTFGVPAVAIGVGFAGCNGFPTPIDARPLQSTGPNVAVAAGPAGPPVAEPPPVFGPTQTQAVPPPPVSGGTLLSTHDGGTAVISDPDRDLVYLVDLASSAVTTLPLFAGDEPGRIVEDAQGRVHVVLRRGGAVVTIDRATQQIVARRPVCAAPRGIAYDGPDDMLYVACATGELVTLHATGGPVVRSVLVDRDLRDVVVQRPRTRQGVASLASPPVISVSRLKSAELLTLSPDGTVLGRQTPPLAGEMQPAVAWRTVGTQSGGLAMVHQRGTVGVVNTSPGGYGAGGGCNSSIVQSTVSTFTNGVPSANPGLVLPGAVLPVDLAESPDGSSIAVVSAGSAFVPTGVGVSVYLEGPLANGVPAAQAGLGDEAVGLCASGQPIDITGQAVGVAYTSTALLVQTRQPAVLFVYDAQSFALTSTIVLSTINRQDTGHDIFHSDSGAFVACASCHPEGHEDGRIWTFDDVGARRTQTVGGTLPGTAPYHWEGDLSDIEALTTEVFVQRMSGPTLTGDQITALQSWLFGIPAPAAPASAVANTAAVLRGQTLFQSAAVGCATCHSGPMFTNNATLDVNTGGQFQVPSLLGVGYRSPFLHDGCAQTLLDRFSPACTDGVSHGLTRNLSGTQIGDLVAYLQTL